MAAFLLIAIDLPHPTSLIIEGQRILFSAVGVGIAVIVTLLANRLRKGTSASTQHASPGEAS